MLIQYLGHSCFLFEWGGKKIIVDPFISGNPLADKIDIDSIKVDYMLITHGHMDHTADVERIAGNNPEMEFIANFEIANHFGKKGIKGHGINHGGKILFDAMNIKYVNAVHTSSFEDGSYAGQPGGFVLWNDKMSFYIAGDTALHYDMKLIPMTCPRLNFAILPIGDVFTMDYKEAIIASQFIECKKIIGCHFDTFPPIEVDRQEVYEAFESKGLTIVLPNIGERIEI